LEGCNVNNVRIQIRDASTGDRDAVREVTLAAYEQYAAVLPEAFWTAYRRNLLATLDGDGPAERIVAEDAGGVVGSVLLYPPTAAAYGGASAAVDAPEVRLLAVRPDARGRGIGAALMEECARRAHRTGARALGLHTMDVMEAAVRMYARMGFVRVPALDFSPAPSVLVNGYRLDLMTPPAIAR
jgi:GNAT superfamily N-acetyltransferase